MLAPLMETLIAPELFLEEYNGRRYKEPNEADIGAREAIVVVNPNKYTVKEEEEEGRREEQASLNADSIEDDDEEEKKPKNNKKGKKETKKKVEPEVRMELDPVELMPNIKLGSKERRQ